MQVKLSAETRRKAASFEYFEFHFSSGKFSICPWKLEKLYRFSSFFIAYVFIREFRNIPTSVVVSYQILFDELKIFIQKKTETISNLSLFFCCVLQQQLIASYAEAEN